MKSCVLLVEVVMIDRTNDIVLLNDTSNLNMVNFTILCIFPILLFFVLFFKSKLLKKDEFDDNCWDINDAKSLQVFAALGVLLHHLTGAATRYGDVFKGPITVLSYVGILFTSIFFFFSGFGLIRSYQNKEGYLDRFLWKKFLAVGVPFVFTNFVYILIGLADRRIYDPTTFFTSVFGFTLINTNAWYLVELMIFYIVFYFVFKNVKDEKMATNLVVISAAVVTLIGFINKHDYTRVNGHWFQGEWWFNTTMMFALGITIGRKRDEIVDKFKKNYKAILISSVLGLVVTGICEAYARINWTYYAETYVYSGYKEKLGMYITQTLLCSCFILFVLLVCMKVRFGNKMIAFLAPFTLEIYLIQDLCMMNYGYESKAPDYVHYFVTVLATVCMSILIHKLLTVLVKYIEDFKNKCYKMPDLSLEKKIIYKKEKNIVTLVITLYVAMSVGFVYCLISNGISAMNEDKLLQTNIENIRNADIFDEVVFATYDSNYKTDGEEPFEWYLLKKDGDRALLLSKYAIMNLSYNQQHVEISYEDSLIRDVLINEGYYDTFSKTERKYIVPEEKYGDTVFLLSKEDIEGLDVPNEILRAGVTYNAKEYSGIYRDKNHDDNTWWWLLNTDPVIEATIVNSVGEIEENAQEVNRPYGGVRPAIWVDIR